jgi:hypothetical protein
LQTNALTQKECKLAALRHTFSFPPSSLSATGQKTRTVYQDLSRRTNLTSIASALVETYRERRCLVEPVLSLCERCKQAFILGLTGRTKAFCCAQFFVLIH